jgi:hypothetical protein
LYFPRLFFVSFNLEALIQSASATSIPLVEKYDDSALTEVTQMQHPVFQPRQENGKMSGECVIDAGRWSVWVMADFHKITVTTLSVVWIMAATTMPLATAQEAALSEGERHGLAACLVKCPDGDKACVNRCMSKSQTKGVVWSDATRACIRGCRIQNAANEVIFGCVAGCLDRMVR